MMVLKVARYRIEFVLQMMWVLTFEELLILSTINGTQPFAYAFLIPRAAIGGKLAIPFTAVFHHLPEAGRMATHRIES